MGASTEEEAAAEARGRATRQSSGGAGRRIRSRKSGKLPYSQEFVFVI